MKKKDRSSGRGEPTETSFYTVKETARHLRLCEKQIRRLVWCGELRAYRFGTALRIKREDLEAYVKARQVK